MTPQILKASPVIDSQLNHLKQRVINLNRKGIHPFLKIILVGQHPPSLIYTENKRKFAEKIGAKCEILSLPQSISANHFIQEMEIVTEDPLVHGCLLQLPLPPQLSHLDVNNLIPKHKDVDGFHPQNLYSLMKGETNRQHFIPCTPKGIITLLEFYKIKVSGQHVVIIGRGLIVGKPLSYLFTNHNATVTLCHSQTRDIKSHSKSADILISAVGNPRFINSSFFSQLKRPVVIDVGINSLPGNKICGDVDFENVFDCVSAITPVPGSVGPLTIFSLTQNLLTAAEENS